MKTVTYELNWIKDTINNNIADCKKDGVSDFDIWYMNGNDGTYFDWECNGRLCEFMIFGDNDMGFVKMCINKSGNAKLYIYEGCGMSPTITKEIDLPRKFDERHLYWVLLTNWDNECIFDEVIIKNN